jgi:hypothetical protein
MCVLFSLNSDDNSSVQEDIKEAYAKFVEYYRNGVERFGIWWTVFTFSVLSIPLILIVFAILGIILYNNYIF